MNDSERALICFLLSDEQPAVLVTGREVMRATCLEWLERTGGDRSRAEIGLAGALREDVAGNYYSKPSGPDEMLGNVLIESALQHINWTRIARALFHRLTPIIRRPFLLASIGPSVN